MRANAIFTSVAMRLQRAFALRSEVNLVAQTRGSRARTLQPLFLLTTLRPQVYALFVHPAKQHAAIPRLGIGNWRFDILSSSRAARRRNTTYARNALNALNVSTLDDQVSIPRAATQRVRTRLVVLLHSREHWPLARCCPSRK